MILKNKLKAHAHTFSFFALTTATLAIALSVTGRSIHAYSEPIVAAAYSTVDQRVFTAKTLDDALDEQKTELNVLSSLLKEDVAEVKALKIEEEKEAEIAALNARTDIPKGLPLEGNTSSDFGERADPSTGNAAIHEGIDLSVSTGTDVVSTADGEVVSARFSDSYGYVVEIDHGNGYTTVYAHNSSLLVDEGDYVTKGQTVASSGNTGNSTGPHLHYEVLYNGTPIDPLDSLAPLQ